MENMKNIVEEIFTFKVDFSAKLPVKDLLHCNVLSHYVFVSVRGGGEEEEDEKGGKEEEEEEEKGIEN